MPELSILTPTYKRAPLLERCLKSVIAHRDVDMEILVSDNASPDETPAVLASIRDPRIRSWRNPTNIGAVRNTLEVVRQARGKWMLYLTDDDFLTPGALDRLLAVLRANDDIGVLISDRQYVDAEGRQKEIHRTSSVAGRLAAGFQALTHLLPATGILSGLAIRREWTDLAAAESHVESMYPQMYLTGIVLKDHPGYYLPDALVSHTVGNVIHWDYTSDFMIKGRLEIVNDLLPGDKWRQARAVLQGQLVDEICVSHFPITWKEGTWAAHQREVLRIREVRWSTRYWMGMMRFFARLCVNAVRGK